MLSPMILDRLDHPALLDRLPARLKQGIDFLRRADAQTLSPGRHDVDGDRLFALVQEYTTKTPSECAWEAHREYADLQYVVRGAERMGYMHLTNARERESYDGARDVAFFEPGEDYVTVHAGMVAIFLPQDVHAPCGAAGAPKAVKKIVVKVALER